MENIKTISENFKLRFAVEDDARLILDFIRELAEYENMVDDLIATEEVILKSIFIKECAKVIIGEYNHKPVAFALFFYNFSTFVGKPGIYLEDLYVKPDYRGKGYGKRILCFLAKLAIREDCGRLEWACLDWNEPSINFYKHLGAMPMNDWTVYRLDKKGIKELARINL